MNPSVAIHCYSQLCPHAFISFTALLKNYYYLITHLLAFYSHLNVSPRRAGIFSFLLLVCFCCPEQYLAHCQLQALVWMAPSRAFLFFLLPGIIFCVCFWSPAEMFLSFNLTRIMSLVLYRQTGPPEVCRIPMDSILKSGHSPPEEIE